MRFFHGRGIAWVWSCSPVIVAALLAACADAPARSQAVPGPRPTVTAPGPNGGGACDDDGAVVDCGRVREQHGDYVTCSMGTRTCENGRWSECQGDRVTLKA